MVEIKSAQAGRFIRSPDPAIEAFLVFGPDAGLVNERANSLADYYANENDHQREPGEVVRIDDSDLAANPDRLAVEVQTIPMFGGRKIVRINAGQKLNPNMIDGLINGSGLESTLIVEGGDLRKNAKLRQIFEKAKNAAAIPCYADDTRSLASLIDEELAKSNLEITQDARRHLIGLIGSDRALSRTEIAKLALFAEGQKTISVEDIDAIVGDTSELTLEMIAYAIMSGQMSAALDQLDRAVASGQTSSAVLIVLSQHVGRLYKVRAEMDNGKTLDASIKSLRPPIHFKFADHFKAQCRSWTTDRLISALSLIQETTRRCRTSAQMDHVFIERLIMALGQKKA